MLRNARPNMYYLKYWDRRMPNLYSPARQRDGHVRSRGPNLACLSEAAGGHALCPCGTEPDTELVLATVQLLELSCNASRLPECQASLI